MKVLSDHINGFAAAVVVVVVVVVVVAVVGFGVIGVA